MFGRQACRVGACDEPKKGFSGPGPCRPKNRRDIRLSLAGRKIDQEFPDYAERNLFQMFAKAIDVPIVLERVGGFDDRPGFSQECAEGFERVSEALGRFCESFSDDVCNVIAPSFGFLFKR